MNDESMREILSKLEVLSKTIANINLFLMSKYPDYLEESKSIRENLNKSVAEKLCREAVAEVMKKLKGNEFL
jgi:hypothetical protein